MRPLNNGNIDGARALHVQHQRMVKHAARRKRQGLHQLLLDKEAKEQEKLEKNRKKAAERAAQLAKEKIGSDGAVNALNAVKFSGTFGVNFQEAAAAAGKEEEMTLEDGVVGPSGLMKSTRKKDALKISKQ